MSHARVGNAGAAGAQQYERCLAEMWSLVVSSLDYDETLAGVAGLAVRTLADFCVIDILEGREVKRLQVAHADPARAALTRELLRFPIDRRQPHMSLAALETGRSVLVPEMTGATLASMTQGEEHRRILEALQPRSMMAVPLLARGRLLGVALFVSSSRAYDENDVVLAERLVQFAALELDNARLYREARQALQARDRVLGIVAHDLRNPLNTIGLSAALLLDPAFSEVQRERQARMILRSAQRMERLIQDLLDIARIEAAQLNLRRELVDPRALVEEAVELHASLAAASSLALRHTRARRLPAISADRDRILQVLSNLIGNAIKFTPAGGSISIRVERADEGVRFSVSDTGPGISAEDLPHLFQPFWQAQRGSVDGAGLGLVIARGIVEAHGGTIRAESAPGKGSTFSFTIPAVAAPRGRERRSGPGDRRGAGTGSAAVPT